MKLVFNVSAILIHDTLQKAIALQWRALSQRLSANGDVVFSGVQVVQHICLGLGGTVGSVAVRAACVR